MVEPRVTVIVTQRERFTDFTDSLNSLYGEAEVQFELIYVDANSPPVVQEQLERESAAKGFRVIRLNEYACQNFGRNIALSYARGEYIIFADNDVLLSPGWITKLLRCADETGASMVGPLYMEGEADSAIIHMGGGQNRLRSTSKGNYFEQTHDHHQEPLRVVDSSTFFERRPTELVEFHCLLARKSVIEKIGPLDEEVPSLADHDDLCLLAVQAGESVWLEPAVVASYAYMKKPLEWCDMPYFYLRWSETWNYRSVERLAKKWGLASDDPWRKSTTQWARTHRRKAAVPLPAGRLFTMFVTATYTLVTTLIGLGRPRSRAHSISPAVERVATERAPVFR